MRRAVRDCVRKAGSRAMSSAPARLSPKVSSERSRTGRPAVAAASSLWCPSEEVGQAPVHEVVVSSVDGGLAHVQGGDRHRRGDRSCSMSATYSSTRSRSFHVGEPWARRTRRGGRPRRPRSRRSGSTGCAGTPEGPRTDRSPRRGLFAAEVVALSTGDDQPGFHLQEQRKVLALRQQRAERNDHAAVVRIVQRSGEPFLHALRDSFSRAVSSRRNRSGHVPQ